MPADGGSDVAAAIAAEIAKQLPVKAATEPGAVQVGALGSDLIKCLRLALLPIRYGAEQFDRYDRFVRSNVETVPLDRRIEPAPQLVGPILEGIRYGPEGSISDEAFGHLLRRAFDRERAGQAHPAFPAITRAMADDEIELLKRVVAGPVWVRYASRLGAVQTPVPEEADRPEFPYLAFPRQVVAYATHLEALGLIHDLVGQSPEDTDYTKPGAYDIGFQLILSDFGKLFVRAVLDIHPDDQGHG